MQPASWAPDRDLAVRKLEQQVEGRGKSASRESHRQRLKAAVRWLDSDQFGRGKRARASFVLRGKKRLKHHLFTFYPQLGCASAVPPLTTPLQKVGPAGPCQDPQCASGVVRVELQFILKENLHFPANTDNSVKYSFFYCVETVR